MSNTHSKRVKGNLVFYEGANQADWIDAIGSDVVKYVDDFVHLPVDDTTGDPTGWTTTVVEAGTGDTLVTSANVAGGAMLITTAGNENDGANVQLNGEAFKLVPGNPLIFGARLKMSDVLQSDFFIGLAITDTDILGGVSDRIGFESLDGSADIKFMIEKDGTETLSAALHTNVNDTYVRLNFYYDGIGTIMVFVNGVQVASVTTLTNLPNDEELRVSLQFLNGEAAAKTLTLDWVRCIQIGRA